MTASVGETSIDIADAALAGSSVTLRFQHPVNLRTGQKLDVAITWKAPARP